MTTSNNATRKQNNQIPIVATTKAATKNTIANHGKTKKEKKNNDEVDEYTKNNVPEQTTIMPLAPPKMTENDKKLYQNGTTDESRKKGPTENTKQTTMKSRTLYTKTSN